MDRLITTHRLRRTCEPSPLWTLCFSDAESYTVCVPGEWNSIAPLALKRSQGVYVKQITCAGTLRFVFGGIGGQADVFLDGKPLCRQTTPNVPFEGIVYDLPYGEHELRAAVTPCGDLPCGMTRPVVIEQLGGAYITAVTVTPRRRGKLWLAEVQATVRSLRDAAQTFDLELTLGSASLRWTQRALSAGGEAVVSGTVALPGAKGWTPAHPHLTDAQAVLWLDGEPADDLCDRIPLREVSVKEDRLLLNGQAYPLTGAAIDTRGALPLQTLVSEVYRAQEIGVCVFGGTNPDLRLADLCDRMGLLLLRADAPEVKPATMHAMWRCL